MTYAQEKLGTAVWNMATWDAPLRDRIRAALRDHVGKIDDRHAAAFPSRAAEIWRELRPYVADPATALDLDDEGARLVASQIVELSGLLDRAHRDES